MKLIKKAYNSFMLILHIGTNYLIFLFSRNDNGFNDYLQKKNRKKYQKFIYIWLLTNYQKNQELNSLLELWRQGKENLTFSKDSKEEKFHATMFESAVSIRDFSMASEISEHFDKNSNYLELAKIFLYVFFNPDKNIKKIVLVDKPRPYYLHYLFPMCEGIIAENRSDLISAREKFEIALKKVEYNFADRVFLDSRIRNITDQINAKQRTSESINTQ